MSGESHPPSGEALPRLDGHACFLLYPIRAPKRVEQAELPLTLQKRLRDGGPLARWLPQAEHAAVMGVDRSTPLWEPAPLPAGRDLHPHVRRMLGESHPDAGVSHTLALKLADLPLQLLQGKRLAQRADKQDSGEHRRRLRLAFNAAAQERIRAQAGAGAPAAVDVVVQSIRLLVFRTRFGIVLVELGFRSSDRAPLQPIVLVEAVHSMARYNRLQWTDDALEPFTLADVVRSLHASEDVSGRGRRVFTVTYAQFDAAVEARPKRRFAIQLARHYTEHYRLADDPGGTRFVAEFDNVQHVVALEGSATVVELASASGPVPPFLRDFESATFRCHYLPITLLAFHEFVTLLHLTNDSSFWPELDRDDPFRHWLAQAGSQRAAQSWSEDAADARSDALARLERLRDEVLRFRLCYRMSHVSYITMHNAVYEALRETWGLDRMLHDVGRDTNEISAFLEQTIAKDAARQVRMFGVVGAAGLSFVAALGLFDKVLALMPAEGTLAGLAVTRTQLETFVSFPAALVVAIVGAWVTWQKTRHASASERDEDLGRQVLEDVAAEPAAQRPTRVARRSGLRESDGDPST